MDRKNKNYEKLLIQWDVDTKIQSPRADFEQIAKAPTCKTLETIELQCEWGGSARCITSDGRNVNMAEELNRLEKELLDG